MASGKSSVLQEELTCPVCLNLYIDPHLLPCGHNFCKACLDRLQRQATRRCFRCPKCSDRHHCSSAFQKNVNLANIADNFRGQLWPAPFIKNPSPEPMSCLNHNEVFRYYCMNDKVCVCNACAEEGHYGHTIKTLKDTMNDLKVSLEKQMYRVEQKSILTVKKIQEQKEKERKNKKFTEDSDEALTQLVKDLKAKVQGFIGSLWEGIWSYWDMNEVIIQNNISRIRQDQARLQEVHYSIKSLLLENDPFRLIEAYKMTGKWCRRQLHKDLYYPQYLDMEMDMLRMDGEMRRLLDEELPRRISTTICHISDLNEGEEEDTEEEAADEEDEDDFLEDFLEDSSEEMRTKAQKRRRVEGGEGDEEEETRDKMPNRGV